MKFLGTIAIAAIIFLCHILFNVSGIPTAAYAAVVLPTAAIPFLFVAFVVTKNKNHAFAMMVFTVIACSSLAIGELHFKAHGFDAQQRWASNQKLLEERLEEDRMRPIRALRAQVAQNEIREIRANLELGLASGKLAKWEYKDGLRRLRNRQDDCRWWAEKAPRYTAGLRCLYTNPWSKVYANY